MGTQEFYANVDLKGNELKNVVVDVVTTLPETATAGRIVSMGGEFYVGNGTKWVKMADDDVVQTLKTTVGDSKDGLVKDVKDLQDAIGSGSGTGTLSGRVAALEKTVGGETSGLVKNVNANASSISTLQSDMTTAKSDIFTNTTNISSNSEAIKTLQTDMSAAKTDITNLKSAVGTSSDDSAKSTAFGKIAKNAAGITALTQTVADNKTAAETELGKKVDKETGKGLSTNDYTTAEKTKLAGIETGAQVNIIESVKVDGTAQAIDSKAVNIDLSGYAKKSEVGGAYVFKGSVADSTKLPTGYGTDQIGWVYNVEASFSDGETGNTKTYPAGTNVAWTGTKWDPLGGQTDFTVFALKTDVTSALANKQDTLTETQLAAVNSSITSTKVSTYDGYSALIIAAQTAADAAQATANKKVDALTTKPATGIYTKVTINGEGQVTEGATLELTDLPNLPASKTTSGTFDQARLPIKVATVDATLSTSTDTTVASGMTSVLMAQVTTEGGKVVFVETTLSGANVVIGPASEALKVKVRIIGLSS